MNLGPRGAALIKSFEELRLIGYPDQRGIPTNGWGHTGPSVFVGQHCTVVQAEAWFEQDTRLAVHAINATVKVPLTQNQFDALVAFTYNVGVGAEAHSTLLKCVNEKETAEAADEFLKWDKAGGGVSAGLLRRRKAERALFLS